MANSFEVTLPTVGAKKLEAAAGGDGSTGTPYRPLHAVVLYASDGSTLLIGQKARASSIPVTLATEDVTALTPVGTVELGATTLAALEQTTVTVSNPTPDTSTLIGSVTETPPASDTASSGLNGRLQRLAQNLTTLLGTAITGQSLEAGGAGFLGWLSSLRKKLPALGTAGTPSADVLTVQGAAGGVAISTQSALGTTARTVLATVTATASGDTSIVAAVASQTIRVWRVRVFVNTGPVGIKLRTATTDLHPAETYQAGGGYVLDFSSEPWYVTGTNQALNINLSTTASVVVQVWYTQS